MAHSAECAGGIQRYATLALKSPERWLQSVEQRGHGLESVTPLTPQEQAEEWLLMRLRLTGPIALAKLPPGIRREKLPFLASQGLITLSDTHFATTLEGRLMLTSLTAALLP
jgi:oxygen-independent coproporphyrinogen-3 oxidase